MNRTHAVAPTERPAAAGLSAAGDHDGLMQLHLPVGLVIERVAAMVDAGARREAIAVLNLTQEALTHQPTPSASRLFTALRTWEGAVVGIDLTEEALQEGAEVEELMRWWSQEQRARHSAMEAAES